jgi:hypothetical protein
MIVTMGPGTGAALTEAAVLAAHAARGTLQPRQCNSVVSNLTCHRPRWRPCWHGTQGWGPSVGASLEFGVRARAQS